MLLILLALTCQLADFDGDGKDQVTLYTEVWTAKDPMCCPTGRGKVRFAVDAKGGKLRRLP